MSDPIKNQSASEPLSLDACSAPSCMIASWVADPHETGEYELTIEGADLDYLWRRCEAIEAEIARLTQIVSEMDVEQQRLRAITKHGEPNAKAEGRH